MKELMLYNVYYESFKDFRNAILGFLQAVSNHEPESNFGRELRSKVRDKFRAMGAPHYQDQLTLRGAHAL